MTTKILIHLGEFEEQVNLSSLVRLLTSHEVEEDGGLSQFEKGLKKHLGESRWRV